MAARRTTRRQEESRGNASSSNNSTSSSSSSSSSEDVLSDQFHRSVSLQASSLPTLGTHKRELSSPSISRLSSVSEVMDDPGGAFGRMSSLNSVEMLQREGGGESGGRRPSPPSAKRSNGTDTPAGIRALKQEAAESGAAQAMPPRGMCSFGGEAFDLPPTSLVRGLSATPMSSRMLIIYPPICMQHETMDHQENKERLVVLCGPQGVLRRPRFEGLEWADGHSIQPCSISDMLRVHEYDYIRHLRRTCKALPAASGLATKEAEEAASSLLASLPAQFQPQASPKQPPADMLRKTSSPSSASGNESSSNNEANERAESFSPAYTPTRAMPSLSHNTSIRDFPVVDLLDFEEEEREEEQEQQEYHQQDDRGGGGLLNEKVQAGGSNGSGVVSQFLDTDTRISRESFHVARVAAGAVIQAVDQAASGRRRTFVVTRPPGHHAGPRGAVPSPSFWKAPTTCSSGFCLLNNVAVGAAYARQTYGRPPQGPFQRIAIVDLDIHHGNGTEEIVRALRPCKRTLPLPASWAPQSYEIYKPWLSDDDADHVFFGSINLVDGVHFYPCSGRAVENDFVHFPNICNVELTPVRPANAPPGSAKPRGLSAKKIQENCQRASQEFREKVGGLLLPKLRAFGADLLFISAGFDGHHADLYHWYTDEDYTWLTRELVSIMENTSGKIISVLEGGYHTDQIAAQPKRVGRPPGRTAKATTASSNNAASGGLEDEEGSTGDGGGGGSAPHVNIETDGGLARGVMSHVLALMDDPSGKLNV